MLYALNCTVCRVALIHHLMPHICVSELGHHWIQAMAYHLFGAIIFSTGLLWTTLGKIQIKIQNFSFMRTHLKMSPAKRRPFFPGVHELTTSVSTDSMHYSVTAFLVESQWPFFPLVHIYSLSSRVMVSSVLLKIYTGLLLWVAKYVISCHTKRV